MRGSVIFLNFTEGDGLVLEVAQQQLQIRDLAQFDIGGEAHAHLEGKSLAAFDLQLLAGERNCGGIAVFIPLFLLVGWQGV